MSYKLPTFITKEEFEKLFEAEKDKEYKLAFLLGFESGMRISEIVGLHESLSKCCKAEIEKFKEDKHKKIRCSKCLKNLKTEETYIDLTRWKIKPLDKNQIEFSANQIKVVSGKGEKDRYVPKPKRFNNAALDLLPIKKSRRALEWKIKKLGKEVLNKEIHFHSLRHGFGSHLANKNMPLHQIQMLMGHSRLDTTGIYLHANPKAAIEGAREVF